MSKWLSRDLVFGPYLTLCLNAKDYAKICKSLNVSATDFLWLPPGVLAQVRTCVNEEDNYLCIVSLDPAKHKTRRDVYESLTHEAVHVWQEARQQLGEDRPGREIEAYAIQRITRILWDEYDRQTKRSPKKL